MGKKLPVVLPKQPWVGSRANTLSPATLSPSKKDFGHSLLNKQPYVRGLFIAKGSGGCEGSEGPHPQDLRLWGTSQLCTSPLLMLR